MFDLTKFIEILDSSEDKKNSLENALKYVKDDLHVGMVEIVATSLGEHYEFIVDKDIDRNCKIQYVHDEHTYLYYKSKDSYKLTDEDMNNIDILLRIVSMHHDKYMILKKAEDAEFISPNTHLPNIKGFMREILKLKGTVDFKNYNSYFINIKGFGLINKIFGSKQGDEAILGYANALKDFIYDDEAIGHLGGDNFVAFINRLRHEEFINLVTMCPVYIKKDNIKKKINLIGIVGFTEIETNDIDYELIVSGASTACQYARNTKKIVVKLTPELLDMVNTVKDIEGTFKEELRSGNFVVYYQPKVDIKSGKIIGVEALSRWIKDGKIIPPGMFVPVLERNGEILNLDLFVLETLCKDIHNYRNQGHLIVPASCNISRRDFESKDIEKRIIDIIKKYNVQTRDIVIEVTETTNLEENERLATFIDIMHQNGIMTSVDDFGTGYSSLSVLRDFKVNEIKIDRSFINRDILNDSDEIIIGSIIDMAKRLNIDVICEGVETKSQAEFLLKLGCNNAQGFLYSKPLPKLEFEALMQKIGTVYD
ncbi:MAG: EAL domain-containing protein [Acholeplasmatales bacterium]|nr:EAL domain-containing protein [Acholeplasmatales bacterium]